MKTIIITALFMFTATYSHASEDQYQKAMKTGFQAMQQAKSAVDFMSAAAQFERIAQAEPQKWLPNYYAAYCYIVGSFQEKKGKTKDQYLDKAQQNIDNAFLRLGDGSELYVLQAFLHQARINIAPMKRGASLIGSVNESFVKAKEENPENPRIYYLEGISMANTPKAFGGGPEKGLPILEKANEKYNAFEPKNELWPSWGKEHTKSSINEFTSKLEKSSKQ